MASLVSIVQRALLATGLVDATLMSAELDLSELRDATGRPPPVEMRSSMCVGLQMPIVEESLLSNAASAAVTLRATSRSSSSVSSWSDRLSSVVV